MSTPLTPSTKRALALAALTVATCAFARVELRGGAVVDSPVVGVSHAGVLIQPETGAARTLGWHEVKRVEGEFAADAAPFARLSEDLWRAIRRLERGDVALAAPIFESLWSRASSTEGALAGPTGLAVARGVTSVRLAEGRLADAVTPWCVAVALRAHAPDHPPGDDAPLLEPDLPPIFVRSVSVERLASAPMPDVVEQDPAARSLFLIYTYAAAMDSLQEASAPALDAQALQRSDVRFVADLIDIRFGAPDGAAAARARLDDTVAQRRNQWPEAWARAARGIAGIEHGQGADRRLGALELLHVPARFASTQPYLAGVALAWASLALEREGDAPHAAALRAELEAISPDHPAIGWLARGAGEIR